MASTWIERLKTNFEITLGDGTKFKPLSFNANRTQELNFAEFDFINTNGTLVDRRRPRGRVYTLELYFQGGNNIDVSTQFINAAEDIRPWQIKHQFYDIIYVQPISEITYDNNNRLLNATKITVTVRETIFSNSFKFTPDAKQVIGNLNVLVLQATTEYFITSVAIPDVTTVNQMQANISKWKQVLATVSADATAVSNYYNAANTAIDNAINDIETAITATQNFLTIPALIGMSVAQRVAYLQRMFDSISQQLINLPLQVKALYVASAGAIMSTLCLASVTNLTATDYVYSSDALASIKDITTTFNSFLAALDTMQTYNAAEPNSFVAQAESLNAIVNNVNYTIEALYDILAQSKKPHNIVTKFDNTVIQLAYEIYGLLPNDSTIDKLIADNNIGRNTMLIVPRGTNILYYA
jgi:hypothetical protein